jgi:hypothetical protein
MYKYKVNVKSLYVISRPVITVLISALSNGALCFPVF